MEKQKTHKSAGNTLFLIFSGNEAANHIKKFSGRYVSVCNVVL